MANYNFSLELSKLDGFGVTKLTGSSGVPTECIVIPKNKNHIYKSEETGRYYLDITCFETPDSKYGSHRCVRSKSREEQEQEKKTGELIYTPILGNLKEFGGHKQEVEEYSQTPTSQPKKGKTTKVVDNDDNDLPF